MASYFNVLEDIVTKLGDRQTDRKKLIDMQDVSQESQGK
jgi:hypothetical protein